MSATPLLTLCLVVTAARSSLVAFEATPAVLKTNISDALGMRCDVTDNQDHDVKRIASIFITKNNGDDVASVTAFDAPVALTDPGNLEVKGSLSATSGEGDLQLSWVTPSLVDLGVYLCQVTAVDDKGHTVVLTDSLTLTTSTPSIDDVVAVFNRKFLEQQQTNERQQETITKQQEILSNQSAEISDLRSCGCARTNVTLNPYEDVLADFNVTLLAQKETIIKQQDVITKQQELLSNQSTEISQSKACTTKPVAFHAYIPHSRFHGSLLTLSLAQTVLWNTVTLNQGGGYDPSTGEFTCPVPGLYVFHVHVQGTPSHNICLRLEKNGQQLVDLTKDGHDNYGDATLSHVMELHAGDVMRVRDSCSSVLFEEPPGTNNDRVNYFMAHIVAVTDCH